MMILMFQVQESETNCSVKKVDYKADQTSGFQVILGTSASDI